MTASLPRPRSAGPVLALTVNAFVWGVSWWPFRHLQAMGLHPLWATVQIYALSALAIIAWRPASLRQLLRHRALWLIMLASGATNATFNWAVSIGDVVRVVLLFYLMPLWSLLLARVILHDTLIRHGRLEQGPSWVENELDHLETTPSERTRAEFTRETRLNVTSCSDERKFIYKGQV